MGDLGKRKHKGNIDMTTLVLTPSIAAMSDELGAITAEIKRLTTQKEAIAAELKNNGIGTYAGTVWKTSIFYTAASTAVDYKKVLADKNIVLTAEEITAYTVTTRVGYLSAKSSKA
jgi:hypothetical protein